MKTNVKNLIYCSSIAVCFFTSCSPVFYAPSSVPTPMISEQGEISVSGIAGVSEHATQFNFNTAYGITNSLAIQLNGAAFNGYDNNNKKAGKARQFDFGLGYYKNLSSTWLFDVYIQSGYGELENTFFGGSFASGWAESSDSPISAITSNFQRSALVAGISYRRKHFSFTYSNRLQSMYYLNPNYSVYSLIEENNTQIEAPFEDEFSFIRRNPHQFFLEHSITLRYHHKQVYLQLQAIGATSLSQMDRALFDHVQFSLGMGINFTRK
jgi:hypothetical protein